MDHGGTIRLNYFPKGLVEVPNNWHQIFNEAERDKLDPRVQKVYSDFVSKVINIDFVKRSDEIDQEYFSFELHNFDSSGLEIKI